VSDALLTLSGVTHTFPNGIRALAPTDLSVAAGSFVSLVGPSGCGKSTLLRIASGLLAPSAGRVERAFSASPGDVGFVFQDATLMPWATVARNVSLPLELAGIAADEARTKVASAIARVGLSEFAEAYPRQLSGGMRMRVSIARAIVTNPRMLLMDEPFAALDELTRFKLNDDLLRLWQANRWTVLFVTHSVREAVFLSERVVVMSPRPGRVTADLAVNLPTARDGGLRLGHDFADECSRVTLELQKPMSGQAT
jgi:NitT/TauT family transport system ATP-binding protein